MSNRALLYLCVCGLGLSVRALPADIEVQNRILERARAANRDLYLTLKSFVCREEIRRFKGNLNGSKTRPIDQVSTNLSFENGTEHYNDILQNNRSRVSLSSLVGAWSEGEFGTLLQQTNRLLETQDVAFVSFATLDGSPMALFTFSVPEATSPWVLAVGPSHYKIPFTTDVWISNVTGEVVKIARKSVAIPAEAGISQIDWTVTLAKADLDGQKWLLPAAAEYAVYYPQSNRREWNQMNFSNYHRYGSESVLRFDGF